MSTISVKLKDPTGSLSCQENGIILFGKEVFKVTKSKKVAAALQSGRLIEVKEDAAAAKKAEAEAAAKVEAEAKAKAEADAKEAEAQKEAAAAAKKAEAEAAKPKKEADVKTTEKEA